MVLRKLSQTLMVSLAFMVATFSSGLLQPAVAYATHASGNSGHPGGPPEEVVVDQTCDDVITPESDGWTVKYDEGYPDTVLYTAPAGYLIDKYCVKTGSSQQGNGPIIVPVATPAASVTIDYPEIDSISHYVVHLVPATAETPTVLATAQICEEGDVTQDVLVTVTNTDDATNEAETYEVTVAGMFKLTTSSVTDGASGSVTFTGLPAGTHSVAVLGSDGTTASTSVTVAECTQEPPVQTTVNLVQPTITDVCGTAGDTIVKPQDSAQITYDLDGNVVTATLVNPDTHDFGANLNGYIAAENGLTATYTATFPNDKPCVTVCPVELDTIHSTNQDTNGWTLVRGAEYVDGGIKLTTPGDWVSGKISRDMSGTLGDLGDVISYSPDAQYLGLHIQTSEGWLTYESIYGGNLWLSGGSENMMDNAPHTGGGQGSPYYGTLEEWAAAFPELQVLSLVVLYTNSVPASVTVTSITIGCVEYTFDKEVEVVEDNVTICHRTRSASNPYVSITVDRNAVDGVAGNSGNQADHYGEHKGPIFNAATMKSGDTWGDIIPPVAPHHNGYNYTDQGQMILRNDCKVTGTPPNVCVASNTSYSSAWGSGAYPETGGGGSFEFKTDGLFLYTPEVASYVYGAFSAGNTSLSDIDQMSYKTMRLLTSTGNNQVVTAYFLYVDLDGDLATNDKSYLVYEPIYNGTVTSGTWQTWDVMNGGNAVFWTSYSDGNPTETWNEILADYPDAIAIEYGFNQGTSNQGTNAAIQDVSFDCGVQNFKAVGGQGGENPETPVTPTTPTTPGQTLGTSVSAAVLPAVLPATGGVDSPFMIVVASILAYGAAYFLQGRRLIARNEAIQA